MQRYFVSKASLNNNTITFSEQDYHHIIRVMRSKVGDQVICTDGKRTARCEFTSVTNEEVTASLVEWIEESPELPVFVTIAQALPKGDKLDFIVQKGTEMGATGFAPFIAERSVVKWTEQKANKKKIRLEKIAKEAAEQAHRQRIPSIFEVQSFHKLLQFSESYDVKLVAYEEAREGQDSEVLPSKLKSLKQGQTILLVIGPEGGLLPEEVKNLQKKGFTVCGLGPRILRTETAALYFLAVVSYETELMR